MVSYLSQEESLCIRKSMQPQLPRVRKHDVLLGLRFALPEQQLSRLQLHSSVAIFSATLKMRLSTLVSAATLIMQVNVSSFGVASEHLLVLYSARSNRHKYKVVVNLGKLKTQ